MNTADAGRRHASMRSVADPERPGGPNTTWWDSPDIRLRRGSTVTAPPAFHHELSRGLNDRRTWGGANRRPVRFLQRHINRRGVTTGIDGGFGGGMETAVQALQRRYSITASHLGGWRPNGKVDQRTWDAITAAPPLDANAISPRAFAEDIREDVDNATGALIADATGTCRLFVQVHARGPSPVAAGGVRVALLLAPVTGTPAAAPNLPVGWAGHIAAGDTNWVAASGWVQPGGAAPYRSPRDDLDDHNPQIVEWAVDFAALGFAAGATVLALVAVHAPTQALATAERNPQTVVEAMPAVCARRIRLDPIVAIPNP